MTQDASSGAGVVVALLIAGVYLLACYAVGRYWRERRGRSLRLGFVVSLVLTPIAGWIVGAALTVDPGAVSLHEAFQETYREVDKKLHAQS